MRTHALASRALGSSLGRIFFCVALIAISGNVTSAEDHVWSSLGGGSFNYWLNWVPQFVPGEDDNAIFELGMDPAYQVTFYEGVTNQQCIFRTDRVDFDLGGCTYTLISPDFGLIVGDGSGHVAEVSLYNGTVDTIAAHIGLWGGSSGTLILQSATTLTVNNHLGIGNDGDGYVYVSDGATVTANVISIGGHDYGNTGTLDVDGDDAEITASDVIRVGDEGAGYLNLMNGAYVESQRGNVGEQQSAYGELSITGESSMLVHEWFNVGAGGTGLMTLTDYSRLDVLDFNVGGDTTGNGLVDVFGTGSGIDAPGHVFVGYAGYGMLAVSQEADLSTQVLLVGTDSSGQGEVTFSDFGTIVTIEDNLVSGHWGTGTVNILEGADVRTTSPSGWIKIGENEDSDGYMIVDSGSTLTAEQAPIAIGGSGSGSLGIYGGAVVHTSGEMFMGTFPSGFGVVTIRDENSAYVSDSGYPARIGDEGEAHVFVEDGASFEKPGACFIAIQTDSVASITIDGVGSLFTCEQLSVGESGEGLFEIFDGHAALGSVDPASVPQGEMHMAGYYTQLTGTGFVAADVVNLDAKVQPGGDEHASLTGALSIEGRYTQGAGRLVIKMKGLTPIDEYSLLDVDETANLDGTLELMPIEGYVPNPGDEFVVLTASQVNGTFADKAGPIPFKITHNPDSVIVTILGRGDLNCDTEIEMADVDAFVLALIDPAAYWAAHSDCEIMLADMNEDGEVNGLDIQPFVERILWQ